MAYTREQSRRGKKKYEIGRNKIYIAKSAKKKKLARNVLYIIVYDIDQMPSAQFIWRNFFDYASKCAQNTQQQQQICVFERKPNQMR